MRGTLGVILLLAALSAGPAFGDGKHLRAEGPAKSGPDAAEAEGKTGLRSFNNSNKSEAPAEEEREGEVLHRTDRIFRSMAGAALQGSVR
jgi:hypothetical protein